MAGRGPGEHPKKIGTQHEFRFTLPNTSFRTKLGIGSELGEYHSPPHYDDDATVYSTCHQKLMGTQISLVTKWNETENLSGKRLKTD